jgi:hypothetical protein
MYMMRFNAKFAQKIYCIIDKTGIWEIRHKFTISLNPRVLFFEDKFNVMIPNVSGPSGIKCSNFLCLQSSWDRDYSKMRKIQTESRGSRELIHGY